MCSLNLSQSARYVLLSVGGAGIKMVEAEIVKWTRCYVNVVICSVIREYNNVWIGASSLRVECGEIWSNVLLYGYHIYRSLSPKKSNEIWDFGLLLINGLFLTLIFTALAFNIALYNEPMTYEIKVLSFYKRQISNMTFKFELRR